MRSNGRIGESLHWLFQRPNRLPTNTADCLPKQAEVPPPRSYLGHVQRKCCRGAHDGIDDLRPQLRSLSWRRTKWLDLSTRHVVIPVIRRLSRPQSRNLHVRIGLICEAKPIREPPPSAQHVTDAMIVMPPSSPRAAKGSAGPILAFEDAEEMRAGEQ